MLVTSLEVPNCSSSNLLPHQLPRHLARAGLPSNFSSHLTTWYVCFPIFRFSNVFFQILHKLRSYFFQKQHKSANTGTDVVSGADQVPVGAKSATSDLCCLISLEKKNLCFIIIVIFCCSGKTSSHLLLHKTVFLFFMMGGGRGLLLPKTIEKQRCNTTQCWLRNSERWTDAIQHFLIGAACSNLEARL